MTALIVMFFTPIAVLAGIFFALWILWHLFISVIKWLFRIDRPTP